MRVAEEDIRGKRNTERATTRTDFLAGALGKVLGKPVIRGLKRIRAGTESKSKSIPSGSAISSIR